MTEPEPHKSTGPPDSRPPSTKRGTGTGRPSTRGSKWMTPSARIDPAAIEGTAESGLRRVQRLGSGGFGEVWLVEYLGALEARKYLSQRTGTQQDAFREAVNTRSVSHPNVVDVYDVTDENGIPVLRMEYVEGRDLAKVVEEDGVITLDRLLPLAIDVADALQATHERNIVHLDLKPSNLILRKDERTVVVTDFGISAGMRTGEESIEDAGGTPFFMAPEVHEKGGRGTTQSDIWSLGVTLYFLASNSYPFPFKEKKPRDAVLDEPRDISESHRYVPKSFWKILRKSLQRDPAQRYATMSELKADLESLAYAVVCPVCGQHFRHESIAGVCPAPQCQSEKIVPVKLGKLNRQDADKALADCTFGRARDLYEKARAEYAKVPECAAEVAEIGVVSKAIAGIEADHTATIDDISELLEAGRLVECVNRIKRARVQFSRSPRIDERRHAVHEALVKQHHETPAAVTHNLRQRNFEEARELLTRANLVLGDPPTLRELTIALGEEPRDFHGLYQEVDRQQQLCTSLLRKARQKLEAFDFKATLDHYTRLEERFPCEEFRRMSAALVNAPDAFATATQYDPQPLRDLAADTSKAAALPHLLLEESRIACEALLEDFPVSEYPAFQMLADRRDLLLEAARAIRERVESGLLEAKEAREEKAASVEHEALASIKDLMVRSDLFDLSTREEILARFRAVERSVEQAKQLYTESLAAIEAREHQKALTALHEVRRLNPKVDERLDEHIAATEAALAQSRELSARWMEESVEVERGETDLGGILASFATFEALYRLADEREQRSLRTGLARLLTTLARRLGEYLKSVNTEPHSFADVVLPFIEQEFVPCLGALPEERWSSMLDGSSELRRAACDLFAAAPPLATDLPTLIDDARHLNRLLQARFTGLPPAGPEGAEADEPPAAAAGAEEVPSEAAPTAAVEPVQEPTPLGAILRSCSPPQGATHPTMIVAKRLGGAFESAKSNARDSAKDEVFASLNALLPSCPPEVQAELKALEQHLRGLLSRDWRSRWMARFQQHALRYTAVVAAIVLAFLAGSWLQERHAWATTIETLAGNAEFADLPAEDVVSWLDQGEDGLARRLQVVGAWAQLQARVASGDSGVDVLPAVAAVDACFEDVEQAAGLRAGMRTAVEGALTNVLADAFDRAKSAGAAAKGDRSQLRRTLAMLDDECRAVLAAIPTMGNADLKAVDGVEALRRGIERTLDSSDLVRAQLERATPDPETSLGDVREEITRLTSGAASPEHLQAVDWLLRSYLLTSVKEGLMAGARRVAMAGDDVADDALKFDELCQEVLQEVRALPRDAAHPLPLVPEEWSADQNIEKSVFEALAMVVAPGH